MYKPKIFFSFLKSRFVCSKEDFVTQNRNRPSKYLSSLYLRTVVLCRLWHYGLWSFQTGGAKLERFLPKHQRTQRKLLNFENWISGDLRSFQKSEF